MALAVTYGATGALVLFIAALIVGGDMSLGAAAAADSCLERARQTNVDDPSAIMTLLLRLPPNVYPVLTQMALAGDRPQ
jgi:hypothetical protein